MRAHDEPTLENPEWTTDMFRRARLGREVLPAEVLGTSATAGTRFEVYIADNGWGWRLLGESGEVIAAGGGYPQREDCEAAVRAVRDTSAETPIAHLDAA